MPGIIESHQEHLVSLLNMSFASTTEAFLLGSDFCIQVAVTIKIRSIQGGFNFGKEASILETKDIFNWKTNDPNELQYVIHKRHYEFHKPVFKSSIKTY